MLLQYSIFDLSLAGEATQLKPTTKYGVSLTISRPEINSSVTTLVREKHHIKEMKTSLFNQLCLEEYYAITNQMKEQFFTVWEKVYEELTEMFSN